MQINSTNSSKMTDYDISQRSNCRITRLSEVVTGKKTATPIHGRERQFFAYEFPTLEWSDCAYTESRRPSVPLVFFNFRLTWLRLHGYSVAKPPPVPFEFLSLAIDWSGYAATHLARLVDLSTKQGQINLPTYLEKSRHDKLNALRWHTNTKWCPVENLFIISSLWFSSRRKNPSPYLKLFKEASSTAKSLTLHDWLIMTFYRMPSYNNARRMVKILSNHNFLIILIIKRASVHAKLTFCPLFEVVIVSFVKVRISY